jgi:hypothetical protein
MSHNFMHIQCPGCKVHLDVALSITVSKTDDVHSTILPIHAKCGVVQQKAAPRRLLRVPMKGGRSSNDLQGLPVTRPSSAADMAKAASAVVPGHHVSDSDSEGDAPGPRPTSARAAKVPKQPAGAPPAHVVAGLPRPPSPPPPPPVRSLTPTRPPWRPSSGGGRGGVWDVPDDEEAPEKDEEVIDDTEAIDDKEAPLKRLPKRSRRG